MRLRLDLVVAAALVAAPTVAMAQGSNNIKMGVYTCNTTTSVAIQGNPDQPGSMYAGLVNLDSGWQKFAVKLSRLSPFEHRGECTPDARAQSFATQFMAWYTCDAQYQLQFPKTLKEPDMHGDGNRLFWGWPWGQFALSDDASPKFVFFRRDNAGGFFIQQGVCTPFTGQIPDAPR